MATKTQKTASPAKTTKVTKPGKVNKAHETNGAVKTRTPRARKEGLRKGQARILQALAKFPRLTEKQIAVKSEVVFAWVREYLFMRFDPKLCKAAETKYGWQALLTRKLVSYKEVTIEEGLTERVWMITATGKKVLKGYLKDDDAK